MTPPKQGYSPSVRERRLIRGLVDAREAVGLTATLVAKRLGWSQPKISHIENYRSRPSQQDVERLLELYGVTSPDREAMLALASEAGRRGWWTDYADVFSGAFASLEDGAQGMREWAPLCVPGLLQTQAYARAVIELGRPDDAEYTARQVAARMLRQDLLSRKDRPVEFHAILDESLLRRPIGGREVLREQLYRLARETTRPNITLQVLPTDITEHAGLEGHFIVMRFDGDDPDVGYAEGIYGTVYLENPPQVSRCNVAFERLSGQALDHQESAKLIKAMTKE